MNKIIQRLFKRPPSAKADYDRVSKNEADSILMEIHDSLTPENALKRFLTHTRQGIETDKSHFTEELFSDIFALMEAGDAIVEAGQSNDIDPLTHNAFSVISAAAALYLLRNINTQRAAKMIEYKKALTMFMELEADKHSPENGETPEGRKEKAIENLENKMRHSGLQFVNLPKTVPRFAKAEFTQIAKDMGIGVPVTLSMVRKCSDFLGKPMFEKVEVTSEALSYLVLKGERAMVFTGHVLGEYAANPFRVHKVAKNVVAAAQDSARLSQDIREHKRNVSQYIRDTHGREIDEESLTLAQARSFNLTMIEKSSRGWSDQDKQDLITIMKDQALHEDAAKRARNSLIVQSVFQLSQLAQGALKVAHGDVQTLWMNAYSFFAAMGPLDGFATELMSERAKANSKIAKKVEKLSYMNNSTYEL